MKTYRLNIERAETEKRLPKHFSEVIKEFQLPFTPKDLRRVREWLESILSRPDEYQTLCFYDSEKRQYSHLDFIYVPYTDSGKCYQEEDGVPVPLSRCCLLLVCDNRNGKILYKGFCLKENLVRDIYVSLRRNKHGRLRWKVIESYFLSKKEIPLEYKGFQTRAAVEKDDLKYGYNLWYDYDTDSDEAVEEDSRNLFDHYHTSADYPEALMLCLKKDVERILEKRTWKKADEDWKNSGTDRKSIDCVLYIRPEEFRERLEKGIYDLSLNRKVPDGIYEVPLFYVTKAWDYLLKDHHLCYEEYRVADVEEPDRTLPEAIAQNEEMKRIWKDCLDIDVEMLEMDFGRFDRHRFPHVTEEEEYFYFEDVCDGVKEWILTGINYPNEECTFDAVSALMDYTALLKEEFKYFEENELMDCNGNGNF